MRRIAHDTGGTSAIEFALTAPVFFALVIAIATGSLALYAQLALQHSVEMAARCASVDDVACATATDVQNYGVAQSYGLDPAASVFTVSTPSCGSLVQAAYGVTVDFGPFGSRTVTLTAQSCFPR